MPTRVVVHIILTETESAPRPDGEGTDIRFMEALTTRLNAIIEGEGVQALVVCGPAGKSHSGRAIASLPVITDHGRGYPTFDDARRMLDVSSERLKSVPARYRILPLLTRGSARSAIDPDMAGVVGIEIDPSWFDRATPALSGLSTDLAAFWMAVDDVAYALRTIIRRCTADRLESGILLGIPPPSLIAARNSLCRELQRHGYPVVGASRNVDMERLDRYTREDLETASLAVHFFDGGASTDAAFIPVIRRQFEIAAQLASDRKARQIVWAPCPEDAAAWNGGGLVDAMANSADRPNAIEVTTTTLDGLKSIVLDAAAGLMQSAIDPGVGSRPQARRDLSASPDNGNGGGVYLIHAARDADEIAPLRALLEKSGLRVFVPDLEGNHERAREAHFRRLRSCDAALIFYGLANEQWVRMKQQDLKKAAGYGRSRGLPAAVFVAGDDNSSAKRHFQALDVTVIRGQGTLDSERMASFITQVRQAMTSSRQ